MNYKFGVYIVFDNSEYQTFATELMNFSCSELEVIISEMECVLNGSIKLNSFSSNIIVVEYDMKNAKISQFDELMGEELTIDLYNFLCTYKETIYYVNKPSPL